MQTIVQLDYAAKQNLLYNFKSNFNKFLHEVVATRNDFPVDTKAMEDDDGITIVETTGDADCVDRVGFIPCPIKTYRWGVV